MELGRTQNNQETSRPGEVWIDNGKVYVKDSTGTGNFATITPCAGLSLLINGVKVEEKTTVREKDVIEIITESKEEEPGTYQVKITPEGLSAVLELKTGTVLRQYVADSEPRQDLMLALSSHQVNSCPFTLAEIMQELARLNIQYGMKHGVIQDILAAPKDGQYTIAAGDPPGETIDEQVELVFQKKSTDPDTADENKKVNFRDMVEILSVEPGTLLAVKHPGVQGGMGRKVTGEIIPPVRPLVYELTAGKGAEVSADGNQVTALIGGSPVVKTLGNRYIISVDPVLQKRGDVDIASGNIRFKGDVVVYGNVCEGMSVQASGRVTINGMIFASNIIAQKDIIIKQNITGSNLVAGGNYSSYQKFFKLLDPVRADFDEIIKLVPGLARHPKLKSVKTGQLIQFLIDKKFPRLPGLINELMKYGAECSFAFPTETMQLLENIDKKIKGLNLLKMESLDDFRHMLVEMSEACKIMESMLQNKANISFGYAINSKIEVSGDVKVTGRGCINTVIHAGGKVNIAGVFRGGEIIAGGDVVLYEAGSEMGAKTLVRTDEKSKILIRKAHEGVRIQIDGRQVNITSTQNNIKAALNKDGTMLINTGAGA